MHKKRTRYQQRDDGEDVVDVGLEDGGLKGRRAVLEDHYCHVVADVPLPLHLRSCERYKM
jgi:hypothetical protein